jgi:hypothetical protein
MDPTTTPSAEQGARLLYLSLRLAEAMAEQLGEAVAGECPFDPADHCRRCNLAGTAERAAGLIAVALEDRDVLGEGQLDELLPALAAHLRRVARGPAVELSRRRPGYPRRRR